MDRQQANQLLDRIGPAHSLSQVQVEEEEITAETAAALDSSHASLARGAGIPHDEILREFGLNK